MINENEHRIERKKEENRKRCQWGILEDPAGALSWVRKNRRERFQEWTRKPLGCYY